MSRNRRLFWPGLLIAIGALALVVNLGLVPVDRLYRLGDLWPVLLVIAGLELLINRARLPSATETAASVLVVVVAVVGAGIYVALGDAVPGGTHTQTFTAPASELKDASLEVDAGSATINVQGSTSLVQDLFQAQVTYSGPAPQMVFDPSSGRVVISQHSSFGLFGSQRFHLDAQLNIAVRWAITVNTGASQNTFDVGNMTLRSIELNTGASADTMSLPQPSGTVPITINGGGLTVHMHRPQGTAASVSVSGGGVSLDFDGRHASAIGSVTDSTDQSSDMFRVSINGGGCTVTMDTASGLE